MNNKQTTSTIDTRLLYT